MNRELYEQERHKVLSTIAGASPDQRPAINLAAKTGIEAVVASSLLMAPIALAYAVNPLLGVGAMVMVGAPVALAMLLSSATGGAVLPKTIEKFNASVVELVAGAFGRSSGVEVDYRDSPYILGSKELGRRDSNELQQFHRKYPEVSAACNRWENARPSRNLRPTEIEALLGAVEKVDALEKTFIASKPAELIKEQEAREAALAARSPFQINLDDRRANQAQVQDQEPTPARPHGPSFS